MTSVSEGITQLLFDWRSGNPLALENLIALVYDDLRRLAKRYLRSERRGHTLQTAALVNETYLRLLAQQQTNWQDRAHFFGVAARIMRHLLIDHARTRQYAKRNGEHQVTLDESFAATPEQSFDLLALNEALERLAAIDARKARIVELRYFVGLSVEETAEALELSDITIKREWLKAKAWLFREMSEHKTNDTRTMAEDRSDT
ncbi:MAG TPA: sigma-70 family RNA polymerase sigma factor [Blastocatellia bacterium]|nr:sigma-70 family RNA polymerase sigma factor [Blastocatellia bacterium]